MTDSDTQMCPITKKQLNTRSINKPSYVTLERSQNKLSVRLRLTLISVKCKSYTYFRSQNKFSLQTQTSLVTAQNQESVPSPLPSSHTPSPPSAIAMQLSHCIILLWLAYHRGRINKNRKAGKKHSCYRKDFFKSLLIEERR
jgi:hypothetical protein